MGINLSRLDDGKEWTCNNSLWNFILDTAFKYSMIKILRKIKGDRGAKKLIRSNKSKVQTVKVNSKSILIDFDQLKDFPPAI